MSSTPRAGGAPRRFGRPLLSGLAAVGLTIVMTGLVSAASAPGTSSASQAAADRVTPDIIVVCKASQLSARIVSWEGAAGSRIGNVRITNTSFVTCRLRNFPRVQLLSARGTVLINGHAASTTAAVHTLAPLHTLKGEVLASNYCGGAPARPVTLGFVLPGTAGRVVSIPLSATDTSGVPPCNGGAGSPGSISMHGWHS